MENRAVASRMLLSGMLDNVVEYLQFSVSGGRFVDVLLFLIAFRDPYDKQCFQGIETAKMLLFYESERYKKHFG